MHKNPIGGQKRAGGPAVPDNLPPNDLFEHDVPDSFDCVDQLALALLLHGVDFEAVCGCDLAGREQAKFPVLVLCDERDLAFLQRLFSGFPEECPEDGHAAALIDDVQIAVLRDVVDVSDQCVVVHLDGFKEPCGLHGCTSFFSYFLRDSAWRVPRLRVLSALFPAPAPRR